MIEERDPELLIPEVGAVTGRILEKSERLSRELERSAPAVNPRVDDLLREIGQMVREASRFLIRIPQLPLPAGRLPTDESLTGLALRANDLQRQLNRWGHVEALVRRQNPVRSTPLYPRRPVGDEHEFTQIQASDDLHRSLHDLICTADQGEAAMKHGCHADIPLRNSEFFQHVQAARRVLLAKNGDRPSRFLDVGCGVGIKVLGAARFFNEAVGLEYDASYLPLAHTVVAQSERGNARVVQGDGLQYEDYDTFDVVYFYRPMKNEELLLELEAVIAERVRPETILIAPYNTFANRHLRLQAARVAGGLYLAKSSQDRAGAIREAAEMIGNAPLFFEQFQLPIWEPILKSSRRRGFRLPQS